MKELYTSPKAEMIEFDAKDVITTSGIGGASTIEEDYKAKSSSWTDFI